MKDFLTKDRWSPYLIGVSIGVLLTFLLLSGFQIGASTAISKVAALLWEWIKPHDQVPASYFHKLLKTSPVVFDWRLLFLIGLFFGALLASKLTQEKIPPKNTLWLNAQGPSKLKRHLAAFVGGALLLLGARLADGCTSGHAISGGSQLSITSWVFMMAVFASAIPTAFFLYMRKT